VKTRHNNFKLRLLPQQIKPLVIQEPDDLLFLSNSKHCLLLQRVQHGANVFVKLQAVNKHFDKRCGYLIITMTVNANEKTACKYNSSFLLLLSIVLLLLLSLSLIALVSYCDYRYCYSSIRLLSRKCGINLSVSVCQCQRTAGFLKKKPQTIMAGRPCYNAIILICNDRKNIKQTHAQRNTKNSQRN